MAGLSVLLLLIVASAISAQTSCKDSRYCQYYKQSFCKTNTHIGRWMGKYCKNKCGLCSATTAAPATSTTGVCKDERTYCKYYKKHCPTGSRTNWLSKYCRKTCNLCVTSTTTTRATPATVPPKTSNPEPEPSVIPTGTTGGQCGTVKIAKSRVVGGTTAQPGAWPWQIALIYRNRFHCGGSLVNNKWIVTAAHCIRGRRASDFKVILGEHDRTNPEGTEQEIRVTQIVQHPGYRRLDNDIALIKLEKPAMFNDRVQPVCLPKHGETVSVGTNCYITGWGKIKHPGTSYHLLQQLKMTVQDSKQCEKLNGKYHPITKQMVCAANPKSIKNQSGCHGDSGGPFVCQQSDKSWKLHGAVSWGSPRCDIKDSNTVFARVGVFRNWIDQYINQ